MGRPPPIIRAMPERKHFFLREVFPYGTNDIRVQCENELAVSMGLEVEVNRASVVTAFPPSCS